MRDLELEPFGDEHLEGAAALLAERHVRHRGVEPLLSDDDPASALEEAWRQPETSGVAALRAGEVVGYLIGGLEGEHPILGNFAWVERAGHAAADPEAARAQYAAAAERWVEAGATRHYVLVPATVGDLDPWYRLGFGHMHVEAIRESGGTGRPMPQGLTIRRGGLEDLETAITIDHLISDVQARSPSFGRFPEPEQRRADWIETLEDPEVAHFIAEREGVVVGHATLYPRAEFGTTADSVFLASTATLPDVRGEGVGSTLTEYALDWAREAGYGSVNTNWRMTNLLASRFWPARGFRPVFHRLYRPIGLG